MRTQAVGCPIRQNRVDRVARHAKPVREVIYRRDARPLSVRVYLKRDRDGMSVLRDDLNAKEHAMRDLPRGLSCQVADSCAEPLA
jgi:hypothetical protein